MALNHWIGARLRPARASSTVMIPAATSLTSLSTRSFSLSFSASISPRSNSTRRCPGKLSNNGVTELLIASSMRRSSGTTVFRHR